MVPHAQDPNELSMNIQCGVAYADENLLNPGPRYNALTYRSNCGENYSIGEGTCYLELKERLLK